ncbi:MAG: DUF2849 domain-containing protein [Rhodospirillaceae bacterium]|nr:DUF2849 domain-containing protein [Rhodospirillaceae bacterium]
MAKPFRPSIVTANRLNDGAVVYLAPDGSWTEAAAFAALARTTDEQAGLEARAAQAVSANIVVDAVAVEAEDSDRRQPLSLRERIRLVGPTVRPDLARAPSGR